MAFQKGFQVFLLPVHTKGILNEEVLKVRQVQILLSEIIEKVSGVDCDLLDKSRILGQDHWFECAFSWKYTLRQREGVKDLAQL